MSNDSIEISTETPTPSQPGLTPTPELDCVKIAEPVFGSVFQGYLIMAYTDFTLPMAFLLDLQTGEMIPLEQNENESLYNFEVSPDGKHLAYTKYLTNDEVHLIVMTADQHIVQQMQIDRWTSIVDWLDNDRLILEKRGEVLESISSLVVYNVNSKQMMEFDVESFPDIYTVYPGKPGWGSYSMVPIVFNGNLTKAVYATYSGISLWDLEKSEEIKRLFNLGVNDPPVWFSDGQSFLTAGTQAIERYQEFYRVDLAGEKHRLTDMKAVYPQVQIKNYMLSPDEERVAFIVDTGDFAYPKNYEAWGLDSLYRLAILDLDNAKVTNLCIPVNIPFGPFWSPDSQFLIFNSSTKDPSVYGNAILILDLKNLLAYKVAEGLDVFGWLADEP